MQEWNRWNVNQAEIYPVERHTAQTMLSSSPQYWLLQGDSAEQLARLPDHSIHAIVTSPPFYKLRNYENHPDQLGNEPKVSEFIEALVKVFRECRRVLRRDGTLWIDIGDTYAGTGTGQKDIGKAVYDEKTWPQERNKEPKFPPKAAMLIPERLRIALAEDGWIPRVDCPWWKTNGLCETVTDRPSRDHEPIYVFHPYEDPVHLDHDHCMFFTQKSKGYFYDLEASKQRNGKEASPEEYEEMIRQNLNKGADSDRYGRGYRKKSKAATSPTGSNLRTVWPIASQGHGDDHFAAFPPELVERCLTASTSEAGCCPHCGTQWQRLVIPGAPDRDWQKRCGGDAQGEYKGTNRRGEASRYKEAGAQGGGSDLKRRILNSLVEKHTVGWRPMCACPVEVEYVERTITVTKRKKEVVERYYDYFPILARPIVLDPFCGRGTAGIVAVGMDCSFVGIELTDKSFALSEKNLRAAIMDRVSLTPEDDKNGQFPLPFGQSEGGFKPGPDSDSVVGYTGDEMNFSLPEDARNETEESYFYPEMDEIGEAEAAQAKEVVPEPGVPDSTGQPAPDPTGPAYRHQRELGNDADLYRNRPIQHPGPDSRSGHEPTGQSADRPYTGTGAALCVHEGVLAIHRPPSPA